MQELKTKHLKFSAIQLKDKKSQKEILEFFQQNGNEAHKHFDPIEKIGVVYRDSNPKWGDIPAYEAIKETQWLLFDDEVFFVLDDCLVNELFELKED